MTLSPFVDRLGGVLVDGAAHREVRDVEAEPEPELDSEMSPAARQDPATEGDDPLHAGNPSRSCQPPMYDISTLGFAAVSAVRSSE